jgi:nucleoside-diphosphate-sugar epimerase
VTLTHHRDFAKGLVGLLGNPDAVAEAFHITSDEFLSWDAIHRVFAAMLGVDPRIVHIPSEVIAKYDRAIGDSLLGDKTHSMIFDNSKIRSFVPDFDCVIHSRSARRRSSITTRLNRRVGLLTAASIRCSTG